MIDAPLGDRSKWRPEWPDVKDSSSPSARRAPAARAGDVSVVTYGRMVPVAMQAAERARGRGDRGRGHRSADRSHPYDWDAVKASVRKTHRVLFLNEDTEVTNFGEHLLRRTVEELFYEL